MMDSRKVNIWMVFGLEYPLFRFMRRRLYPREDNQEMDTSSQVNATDSSLHVPCPCRSWHCYPLGFHDTTCFRLFSFLSGCYFSSPMALLFLCLSILRILSDRSSALVSALLTSSFCSFTLGNFIYSQGFNYICISRVLKPPLHPSPGPKCPTSSSNSTLPNTKPLSYHFLPPHKSVPGPIYPVNKWYHHLPWDSHQGVRHPWFTSAHHLLRLRLLSLPYLSSYHVILYPTARKTILKYKCYDIASLVRKLFKNVPMTPWPSPMSNIGYSVFFLSQLQYHL